MKKFLIDTYRIFLLQTSKVIWDIVGCTIMIWTFFYFNITDDYSVISFSGIFVGLWMAMRLYWPRGRKRMEEIELLRPVSLFSPALGTFLVLLFFCFLIYGITGFFYYNFRFIRLTIWLLNNFDINISKNIIYDFSNSELHLSQKYLVRQASEISNTIWYFWFYVIPVVVALRLKITFRILFIIFAVFSAFMFRLDLHNIATDTCYSYTKVSIFYTSYFLMLIYLIIPKKINFK